jgi:hypothetical protein
MTKERLVAARQEAERFLKRAEIAMTDQLQSESGQKYISSDLSPSKHTGALRRASMDLTRALAELRRPQ